MEAVMDRHFGQQKASDWIPVDMREWSRSVTGQLFVKRAEQDVIVKLKHFGTEGEQRSVGFRAMTLEAKTSWFQRAVRELAKRFLAVGAYGIIEPEERCYPAVEQTKRHRFVERKWNRA